MVRLPDRQGVVGGTDVVVQPAVHGVVLEQMRERLRVRDVVHGDELERRLAEAGAEHIAADTTEPVDADADRHACNSPFRASRAGARKSRRAYTQRVSPGSRRRDAVI